MTFMLQDVYELLSDTARVSEYNDECKHVQDLDALGVLLYVAVALSSAVLVAEFCCSVCCSVLQCMCVRASTRMSASTCKISMH